MSERQDIFTEYRYKIQKFFYLFYGEKFFKKKRYDWGKYPKRYEILQEIINLKNYKSYLEIGCDKNENFSNIKIETSIGIDPVEGGTHKMTSDEFFIDNKKNFDIVL